MKKSKWQWVGGEISMMVDRENCVPSLKKGKAGGGDNDGAGAEGPLYICIHNTYTSKPTVMLLWLTTVSISHTVNSNLCVRMV